MIHEFIGVYRNAVDPDLCDWVVQFINRSPQVVPRNYKHVKDTQICMDAFSPGEAQALNGFVNECLKKYVDEYPYLQEHRYISSLTLLQKTEPKQGYHTFHEENINWNCNSRAIAWMVYLNDVEEGGETEFLYQQYKIKPKKGTVVIWPGSYTHLHRGNPPISDKYIATGWYTGSMGLTEVALQA